MLFKKIITIFILISLLNSPLNTNAFAGEADLNWSFRLHPHLHNIHRSQEESDKAVMAIIRGIEHGDYCVEVLTHEFRYYNSLYPRYSSIGTEALRWRLWRYHVVRNSSQMVQEPNSGPAFCAADEPSDKLNDVMNLDYDSDMVFCGRYSREPGSPVERHVVALIDELLDFARFGSPYALHSFVLPLQFGRHIQLNADVEYFMQKILQISGEPNFDWSTGAQELQMSTERKQFVDDAVARGDLQSVLDTTMPCHKE